MRKNFLPWAIPSASISLSDKADDLMKEKIIVHKQCGKEEDMEYKFTDENFEEEVLKSEIPVLVDFYADWCGPCKMMGPVIEKLAEELQGKVKIGKCDTEDNMKLCQQYRITNIPAFIVFRGGKEVERFIGAMSANDLKNKLLQAIGE